MNLIYPDEIVNKILCGDSAQTMEFIPSNSIHLIITSPPYNVGMEYGTDDRKDYET